MPTRPGRPVLTVDTAAAVRAQELHQASLPLFSAFAANGAGLERLYVHTNRFAEGDGRDGEKIAKKMAPLRFISDPGGGPDRCRHYDGDCGDGLCGEE
jgi:hypothetical protein